ncbi:estradiol 17-beta-dehydrogenase 2 [Prorops nasuta]|uniref:estradiol 17-beta-dehydrogenase 2 n=1 Tax=Prorops nasuta TaxID=863751 RepID=UPI0034CE127E
MGETTKISLSLENMLHERNWNSWIRRHLKALLLGLANIISILYLWSYGYAYTVIISAVVLLGGTLFYWSSCSSDAVAPNQVVVITGCDSGLGYSLALYCRHIGITVIAGVLQIDGPGAKVLSLHENIHVHHLDITNTNSIHDFVKKVHSSMDEGNLVLRTLVNNAAVMVFGEYEWQTEDQIEHQVRVNLLGTMKITRAFLPILRAQFGRIILISSHCGFEPLPGVAVYSATKAALKAWASALRLELKKYGVSVVSFVPGSFAQESNILAQQGKYFNAMKATMLEEATAFYGDYFQRYAQYFSQFSKATEPKQLENSLIYEKFYRALVDKYPSLTYKCEPWRYFFYHLLFKMTPTYLHDKLIESFMMLPRWEDKKKAKIS